MFRKTLQQQKALKNFIIEIGLYFITYFYGFKSGLCLIFRDYIWIWNFYVLFTLSLHEAFSCR